MAAPHPAINAPGLPSCDIARVALFANQECGTSRDTAFLRRCLRDCVTNPRRSTYRYDSVPRTSGASTNHASAPQNLSPDSRGYPIASLLRPTFTSAEDQHGLHPPSGYMLCFTHMLKDAQCGHCTPQALAPRNIPGRSAAPWLRTAAPYISPCIRPHTHSTVGSALLVV